MGLEFYLRILGGLILLGLNAFFVAAEFALTRLRQYDRNELGDSAGLNMAWKMTETLEIYLTSCQVGITTTSILLGVIAEPAITRLIESLFTVGTIGSFSSHTISIVLSVTLINLAHTIWGEQTPTYLGVERAKTVARYFAEPLYWWTYTIYPVLYIGDRLTKATLWLFGIEMSRSWLKEDATDGAGGEGSVKTEIVNLLKSEGLPGDRRDEVVNALEIGSIPVTQIMIPKQDVITLSTNKSFKENLQTIAAYMHARYPLVGGSLNDCKGILYTPEITAHAEDLLAGKRKLDDFDWPKMTISGDLSVSSLIDQFQEQHHELALVEQEGKIIGIVTLTDAIETIVGSVEDPLDIIAGQNQNK